MAVPKTFTGGERLFAEDLNSNFEALDTRLSGAEFDIDTNAANLNASNLTSGAVPSDRLTSVPAESLTGDVAEARLPYVRGAVSTSDFDGVTVTFPAGSFSTTPTILLGASALGPRLLSFRAATASSFILDSYQLDGNRNDIVANWMAVGT